MPDNTDPNDESGATTFEAEYDWTNVSPTTAIVEAVADSTGSDQTDLHPLYRYVDPDALESIVRVAESAGSPLTVRFSYGEYVVELDSDGALQVFQ